MSTLKIPCPADHTDLGFDECCGCDEDGKLTVCAECGDAVSCCVCAVPFDEILARFDRVRAA